MKKKIISTLIGFATIGSTSFLNAQEDWVKMMQDPVVNFYETKKSFNRYVEQYKADYRKARGQEPNRIPGLNHFKRWEWFMQPRVSQSGERFSPYAVWEEMVKYKKQYRDANIGNWTLVGPTTNTTFGFGSGRLNFVRIHPTQANTIFVGSPSGGLWKSTDGGSTWTTNTDNLPQVIGCSDLAIDPANPNTIYLATGDAEAYDNYSVGLLKSIDGGSTWNPTGYSASLTSYRLISRVLIYPTNSNIILLATSAGIFRSTDAGASFTLAVAGNFKDMEFKPGSPQTVYACGTQFYKSVNGGQTWALTNAAPLPVATGVSRMAIAVTPADPALVYLIVGLPDPGYGTEGFYKSTNSGATFTKTSTPNTGKQQWYDLSIAASPTNKDEIHLGGQDQLLKSIDGGATFNNSGGGTHVDYHDLIYTDANTVYVACDGGVWKSTNNGTSWVNRSNGLQISQMYGFDHSTTDPNITIQGWQDNGTNLQQGTIWNSVAGGDGMLPFFDWNDDQNVWASVQLGQLLRSTDRGYSFNPCGAIPGETGAWTTPWLQDPNLLNTIYAGYVNVWKSTDGGLNWTKKSSFSGTSKLSSLSVSPANSDVIWATDGTKLYNTSDGGTNWTTITNLPAGFISGITCHNTDANKAWIVYSGFNSSTKVFQTNDHGTSWTNLSASLPNIPINCVTFMNGSNDGIYIGTDAGVLYKDASLSVWQPFSTGMPNVTVTQLKIHYGAGKIRASTYGRGLWESTLYQPGTYSPTANFKADKTNSCSGTAVKFSDYSLGQPTSWNWSFLGGKPSSSTLQNPVVIYNTPGTHPVTLEAINANGNNSLVQSNYIVIGSSSFASPTTSGAVMCTPGVVLLTATGTGLGTLRWWNAEGGGMMVNSGANYSPNLTTTTTFYVDEIFPADPDDIVGKSENTGGSGGFFADNDVRGMYFDVLQPLIIKSFDVYANSAGNRTIEILDKNGNWLMDTTVFIPASPTTAFTVNVNFILSPGTNYFIKFRGTVDCFRNNLGATYPYTSTGINLTGTNASTPYFYYYFYNIIFSTLPCNTPRISATGTIGCIGIKDEITAGTLKLSPNPSNGKVDLSFYVSDNDNYIIKIINTLGETVYEDKVNNFSGRYTKKINIEGHGKGVYILSLSNAKNETVKKLIVY